MRRWKDKLGSGKVVGRQGAASTIPAFAREDDGN